MVSNEIGKRGWIWVRLYEVILACLQILSQQSPKQMKENHDPSEDSKKQNRHS
jgi:hypothetical protein